MTAPTSPLEAEPSVITALRAACRRSPAAACQHIRKLLLGPSGVTDPTPVADLHALHAEVLHHSGHLDAALEASVTAARAAGELRPQDWPRLTTALVIGADLAVWAGQPHAVTACDSARNAFTYLQQVGGYREVVAAALHAVAVFHHLDTAHGYALLHKLTAHATGGGPLAVMLANGLAAMRTDQPHTGRPKHQAPPAVPGGLLQPRLDVTTAGYLASRVHAQPRHDPAVLS